MFENDNCLYQGTEDAWLDYTYSEKPLEVPTTPVKVYNDQSSTEYLTDAEIAKLDARLSASLGVDIEVTDGLNNDERLGKLADKLELLLARTEAQIEETEAFIAETDAHIVEVDTYLTEAKVERQESRAKMVEFNAYLEESRALNVKVQLELDELVASIAEVAAQIAETDVRLKALEESNKELWARIYKVEQRLGIKEAQVGQMTQNVVKLSLVKKPVPHPQLLAVSCA